MTRRKNTKATNATNAEIAALEKKVKKLQAKQTPFRDTGGIIGRSVGGIFGNKKLGSGLGRWLGSGIGSIFGSGDYTLVGPQPAYNVLTNSTQVPKFDTVRQTNIISHREYLQDITGTTNFSTTSYPLNPGIVSTFPWLANIAQNYQEYIFHGLIFEFRPLITDFVTAGAPGVVVMATNYNADAPTYISKQEMENSEYATSVKPTNGLIHGIECARNMTVFPQRYTRNGNVPPEDDLRLYDYGTFQFATQGNPLQLLGELWVSYCVEFLKPKLPANPVGIIQTGHCVRSSCTSGDNLGTIQLKLAGNLPGFGVGPDSFSWIGIPGQHYLCTIYWNTGGSVTTTNATWTPSAGLAGVTYFANNTTVLASAPNNGVLLSTQMEEEAVYLVTAGAPSIVTINVTGGTPPVGGPTVYVDVVVTTIDESSL